MPKATHKTTLLPKQAVPTTFNNRLRTIVRRIKPYTLSFGRWCLIPGIIYLVLFFLMQPQYVLHFSDGFYLDDGDGFQNVWNVWWVNKAVVELHTSPYFTTMLHWPHGINLVPQTMNIINAFVAIPLIQLFHFSLVEAINFAVVSAFVFSGVTMAWFIQKLYRTYWVSIIAGALFTFSSYHFAHGQGHLQLVTLQYIPLFLLAFWTLLEKMKYRYAILAAGALFLVLLSDYYYLFWSVIVGGLWLAWCLITKKVVIARQFVKVISLFVGLCILLVGPLVYKLIHLTKQDPLLGSHDATVFSLDPLSVIIPGGSWYWHPLTDTYTNQLAYFAEASMFFGYGLLALLAIALVRKFIFRKSRGTEPQWLSFWWIILIVFFILALGPRLHTLHRTLDSIPLPYAVLEKLFPTLELSGMPIRWILIALIAAIIIGSHVLTKLNLKRTRGKILLGAFILVSLIDLWPRPLPLTSASFEPYVYFLQRQPYGAVLDDGAKTGSQQLYNQTLHNKPLVYGYVTRTPRSVDEKDFLIFAATRQGRVDSICRDFKIRYYTTAANKPIQTSAPIIYSDKQVIIYDLKNNPNC